jgi:hypothetical protein
MTTKKNGYGTLPKAIKRNMYFLGLDADNVAYYLKAPSWDCDWYWGFGYIQGYRKNIIADGYHESHQHADNFLSEWFTEWNGSQPILTETSFTEKEGWILTELFRQFYQFREMAELYYRGNMHVTSSSLDWTDKAEAERINKEVIPKITNEILKILTPNQ